MDTERLTESLAYNNTIIGYVIPGILVDLFHHNTKQKYENLKNYNYRYIDNLAYDLPFHPLELPHRSKQAH